MSSQEIINDLLCEALDMIRSARNEHELAKAREFTDFIKWYFSVRDVCNIEQPGIL